MTSQLNGVPSDSESTWRVEFGRRLAEARKSANFTQRAAADSIGTNERSITRWELGRHVPSAIKLFRLAELYEVSIDYLMSRVAERKLRKRGSLGIAAGGSLRPRTPARALEKDS